VFAINSRYQGIPTTEIELPDGRKVVYLLRRLLPKPEELSQIGEHEVRVGERLDGIAYAVFGDPEQFWRIADGNRTMNPDDLVRVGEKLRITLPAGIPAGALLGGSAT
jgi:hypothetical protein